MLEISIDLEELNSLENYLKEVGERTNDFKPIERKLGELQREELRKRFLSSPATEEGGVVYGDVYWNRLSDWYLNQVPRRRKGQIMIDTKKLQTDSTTEGAGNTSRVENNGVYTFTINTYYAQTQNNLRQLLFWSEELIRKTEALILDYITGVKK